MWTDIISHPRGTGLLPTRDQADRLARHALGGSGTRYHHVRAASYVAESLSALFTPDEAALLVAAAWLHDIGYSPRLARTGFHPFDGAVHLREQGFADELAELVAHHSHAVVTAPESIPLCRMFPRRDSLLHDALVYADMHASPAGRILRVDVRLSDIERRHGDARFPVRARLLRESVLRIDDALAALPGRELRRTSA